MKYPFTSVLLLLVSIFAVITVTLDNVWFSFAASAVVAAYVCIFGLQVVIELDGKKSIILR